MAKSTRIFLIGMMGSGKSYWMQQLSGQLNIHGYDLDALIETACHSSISKIFEEHGEPFFRENETAVLRSFAAKENFILATGGGTPCFNDNMRWMNANGITVWIDEPVDILAERLVPEKPHRPLIAGMADEQLPEFLQQKRNERTSFYSQATFHIQHPVTKDSFTSIINQYV